MHRDNYSAYFGIFHVKKCAPKSLKRRDLSLSSLATTEFHFFPKSTFPKFQKGLVLKKVVLVPQKVLKNTAARTSRTTGIPPCRASTASSVEQSLHTGFKVRITYRFQKKYGNHIQTSSSKFCSGYFYQPPALTHCFIRYQSYNVIFQI